MKAWRVWALWTGAFASVACGSQPAGSEAGTGAPGSSGMASTTGGAGGSGAGTTYVLVHGGWHGSWAWEKAVPLLEAAGDTAIAPTLPAHGGDPTPPSGATLDSYAQTVVDAIDAQSDNVVLVGHSMAGAIISSVAEARPGRVRLLVYLAAVLLEDSASVVSVTGSDSNSVLGKHIVFGPDGTLSIDPAYVVESLYADCSAADASAAAARLGKEPLGPLAAPIHVTDQAWGSVPRIYIHTLQDKAISPAAQTQMVTKLPCKAVVEMQTSHSPFYCGADDFVGTLREAVAANAP